MIPAFSLIFSLAFLGVWMRDRSARHVLGFAIGQALTGIGFLLFHYVGTPDDAAPALVMHLIYCAACTMLVWGVCRRAGTTAPLRTIALVVLVSSGLIALSSIAIDKNPRLFAANTSYAIIMGIGALTLLRTDLRAWVDRAILALFAVTSLQFFVRPQVAAIVMGPMTSEAYRASWFYSVLIVTMAVVSLLMTMALAAAVLKDLVNAIRQASELDHLTGLKTRRPFEQSAMDRIEAASDARVPLSMIVADIDHFKQVNDIWGHPAGDAAIAAFGRLIGGQVRDTDICGRIGGEEFAILVWDCELAAGERLAERIRIAFANMQHVPLGKDIRLSASFGVASVQPGEGFGKLYARADSALYNAKASGRNRVEAGRPSQADSAQRGVAERRGQSPLPVAANS
ncbi:hypothetical protein BMF35_a2256 [Aurantiacibacter gangjinensis]|nr:hypothetical protein BMF35_a2256 [Aurantiacibacter gangjinensis]